MNLNKLISVAKNREHNKQFLKLMLQLKGEEQRELFNIATSIRNNAQGNGVNLRGVIEFSNRCSKNCNYCAMRRDNCLERYTLSEDEIMLATERVINSGINTVFLQSGEFSENNDLIERIIKQIYQSFKCDIILCAGNKERDLLKKYKELGCYGYILKYETINPDIYESATGKIYSERLSCIQDIKKSGLKLGTGNIVGLPNQTIDDIVDDVIKSFELLPDFISVSPFVPSSGTPYENIPKGNIDITLNLMAIWRIAFPQIWIPTVSALELLRSGGQVEGLKAGANVITINFTPSKKREQYFIYDKKRFVVNLDHAKKTAYEAKMTLNMDMK